MSKCSVIKTTDRECVWGVELWEEEMKITTKRKKKRTESHCQSNSCVSLNCGTFHYCNANSRFKGVLQRCVMRSDFKMLNVGSSHA